MKTGQNINNAYTDCSHTQNETHISKQLQILKFSIKSYIYKVKKGSETTNLICLLTQHDMKHT